MCAAATSKTFIPPSKRQRAKALGDTYQLNKDMRRAVTVSIDNCFPPLPVPGEDDWIANHDESGQTVADFERMMKESNSIKQKNVIHVQPIEFFKYLRAPSLEAICDISRPFFPGCQFAILPEINLGECHGRKITQRINRHTRQLQYSAEDIIENLKTRRRRERKNDAHELFCVAVTMVDIYPEPSWNFVFGLASEDDRIGVYSFARLDPLFPMETVPPACTEEENRLILKRGAGVFIHEIIHLFGVDHCIYYHCMMNGGETLEEMDRQPFYLCPICLRKMYSALGGTEETFHTVQMYTEILNQCRRFGFKDEMAWYEQRLQVLMTKD